MSTQTAPAMTAPIPAATKLEYWRELRSMIMHEDNLVNHRFSWLLTFEGFLLGGFFLVQSGILSSKLPPGAIVPVETFLLLVLLLSMWICFITGQTISAAYRQTATAHDTWKRQYPEESWQQTDVPPWFWQFGKSERSEPDKYSPIAPAQSEFPPILGDFRFASVGRTLRIPFILFTLNVLAAVACIVIACNAHFTSQMSAPSQQPAQARQPCPTDAASPQKR